MSDGPLAACDRSSRILDPASPIAESMISVRPDARAGRIWPDSIRAKALAWAVGRAEVEMRPFEYSAGQPAGYGPAQLLHFNNGTACIGDGTSALKCNCTVEAVVDGDASVAAIGATLNSGKGGARTRRWFYSTVATRVMGFQNNTKVATKVHIEALSRLGVSKIHRCSFYR